MIGLMYHGEVRYISSFEDFKEVMEPEVYDALRQFHENRIAGLENECSSLSKSNEELKNKVKIAKRQIVHLKEENAALATDLLHFSAMHVKNDVGSGTNM